MGKMWKKIHALLAACDLLLDYTTYEQLAGIPQSRISIIKLCLQKPLRPTFFLEKCGLD